MSFLKIVKLTVNKNTVLKSKNQMCVNRRNENTLINTSNNNTEIEEVEFPNTFTPNEHLFGCTTCYYPVAIHGDAHELLVTRYQEKIYVGVVVNTNNLLTNTPADNSIRWQRQVFIVADSN